MMGAPYATNPGILSRSAGIDRGFVFDSCDKSPVTSDQWSGNTDHLIRDSNCVANHDDAALVAAVPLQVVALTDCCRRHCMAQRVPGCLMKTAADFAAGVAG